MDLSGMVYSISIAPPAKRCKKQPIGNLQVIGKTSPIAKSMGFLFANDLQMSIQLPDAPYLSDFAGPKDTTGKVQSPPPHFPEAQSSART